MKYINDNLSADYVRQALTYCPETGAFTWNHRKDRPEWFNRRYANKPAGTADRKGYIMIMVNKRLYKAHRLAWLIAYGQWPDGQIDHINGITDDNRLSNLRQVTNSVNQQNQRFGKRGATSSFLGVSFHKPTMKWRAAICVNGKAQHIGLFQTEGEAHKAYLIAKSQLHEGFVEGRFA